MKKYLLLISILLANGVYCISVWSQTVELVDTIYPGLHIYKRAVASSDDNEMIMIRKKNYRKYYKPEYFVYNIGSSSSKTWFAKWQNDIYSIKDRNNAVYDSIRDRYIVVYDSVYHVYNLQGTKIVDDYSDYEPKIWHRNLILLKQDSIGKGIGTAYFYNIAAKELRYTCPNASVDYLHNRISLRNVFVDDTYELLDSNLHSLVPNGYVYEGHGSMIDADLIICKNKQTNQEGLFGLDGKILLPAQFDYISPYETTGWTEATNEYLFATYTYKSGPDSFKNIQYIKYVEARAGDTSYYFNSQFELLIKEKHVNFFVLTNYIALIDDYDDHPHKEGIFDTSGRVIVPVRDWDVSQFIQDVYFKVEKYPNVGYYSISGEEIFPVSERDIDYLGYDLFLERKVIKRMWKYAFVGPDNVPKTQFIYDYVSQFNEGFCIVKIGKEFQYLDTKLNVRYSIKADDAELFNGGKARIEIKGKYFWINTNFEIVERQ